MRAARSETLALAQLPHSHGQLELALAEHFPIVDVEGGNELFWYIFDGEPKAKDGHVELDENLPGLGLTINERALENFTVIE